MMMVFAFAGVWFVGYIIGRWRGQRQPRTYTLTSRPLTPAESVVLDQTFVRIDEVFAELRKIF